MTDVKENHRILQGLADVLTRWVMRDVNAFSSKLELVDVLVSEGVKIGLALQLPADDLATFVVFLTRSALKSI